MEKLKAYAKINLYLKVKKKSFFSKLHRIDSKFQIVDNLYDTITIQKINENENQFFSNIKLINDNPIEKVFKILNKYKLLNSKYRIEINKEIPTYSGLGGFSSICVQITNFFLKNKKNKLIKKIQKKVCNVVGSDCYFFFSGYECALVSKIGNKVKISNDSIKISKSDLLFPPVQCVTKDVFKIYKINKMWIKNNEINMLTPAIIKLYPKLKEYYNPIEWVFSGSGSTLVKRALIEKKI
ncbi:hypothetical protein [Spiroplasma endosymbiont of Aspidapion aeneum]|uniref:hypothetical protein n=1 Tax=Spiroplasma endosymbiont of Aspidapion aeneum TaxID=3066276 RepID=UPI00313C056C